MNDSQVMHALHLEDSYHVEKVLANGACGVTELVTIEGAGPFVRKKIPLEFARRRVWSALSDCDSSRLPKVESTYELPDYFVVVYDFVPGESLDSYLQKNGPLSCDEAMELTCQVCEAVQALHEQGIIHRDITPANILVCADGAHLLDLGIARMRKDGASRDTAPLGTWDFASPEQFGFVQSDVRSDVYSIGRVLACALTGLRPSDEGYDEALCNESTVPVGVRAVIRRACSFEPSARFQSAAEMAQALDCLRNGRPLPTSAVGCSGSAATDGGVRLSANAQGTAGVVSDPASNPLLGASANGRSEAWQRSDAAKTDGVDKAAGTRRPGGTVGGKPGRASGRLNKTTKVALAICGAALAFGLIVGTIGTQVTPNTELGSILLKWFSIPVPAQSDSVQGESAQDAGGSDSSGVESGSASDGGPGASSSAASKGSPEGSSSDSTSSSGGASSGAVGASDATNASHAAFLFLKLKESGWSVGSEGVSYIAGVKNTNASDAIEFPAVRVTAYGNEGEVLFSDELVGNVIRPGETVYLSGFESDCEKPSRLKFDLAELSSQELCDGDSCSSFSVKNVSRARNDAGERVFTGELCLKKARANSQSAEGARVTVVLRDAKGKIAGYQEVFVDGVGQGFTSFETQSMGSVGFEDYDVHVQSW
ncbi:MAG: serine/threonine-protein kinase [Coriobacteriia bacterium]|nr:serine/threonine-protein kinase [Coriobacteriia bacterium]